MDMHPLTLIGPCVRNHRSMQTYPDMVDRYPGLLPSKEEAFVAYISDAEFSFTVGDKLPQRVIRAHRIVILDGIKYIGDMAPQEFEKHFKFSSDGPIDPTVHNKLMLCGFVSEVDGAFSALSHAFDNFTKYADQVNPEAADAHAGVMAHFQSAYRAWHHRRQ